MYPSSSMDPSKWFHGYNGSSIDTLMIPWVHSVFRACIHRCIQLSCSCFHGSVFLSSFQKAFIMELASGSKIAKSVSKHTLVIHGCSNKYPWNLDMMMKTFTHVHGCTLMLLCKSTGFLWKQDGFP